MDAGHTENTADPPADIREPWDSVGHDDVFTHEHQAPTHGSLVGLLVGRGGEEIHLTSHCLWIVALCISGAPGDALGTTFQCRNLS